MNEIKALKRSNGKWCYNEETLRTEAILCFQNLYTLEAHASGLFSVQMKFPFIETSLLNCIVRNLTSKEVRDALLEMAPLKASGADGLHAQFYQSQWSILGESLVSIVLKVFEGGSVDPFLNRTLIMLISKVRSELISQFRSISLCTVPYKVLSKMLVN
ncbi:hypothetical protein GOBAR_AA34892 [Gossypium barbadense]|uniref:Reverse transcriptase domain-containing protein n=1 Tax=Gossypium barbadense TaxID=3634 RepID=A0A2P5W403_GOSBA|nr:hypothetical protein GOBAR_AA34892 [Gossypium barbadense]